MTSKDFLTPSRQHVYDTSSPKEEVFNFLNEVQSAAPHNASKRKPHNPLCVNSSKFLVKSVTSPPFFQDSQGNLFESTDVTHSCVASEPINGSLYFHVIEHLDLNNFKTKPCSLNTQHNHKHCPYYHNAKDRKRVGFFYSAELCDFAEKDGVTCSNQDMCPKAHNRVEQLYRPEKYKTKFCTFYPHNLEKCDYGSFCSFAHNENDISIDLIHNYEYDEDFYMFHFKTVWCPFNLTQHDKALCVYAHNWQDYRRKPNVYNYEPTPCSNWKSTDFILNYEDGCPFKEKCTKCHGWKEHEYHPLNYKSKPCPAGKNCAKGRDCPHFHVPRERKVSSSNVVNRVFRYVPRNRIVTNTFKIRSEDRPVYYPHQAQPMTVTTSASSLGSYPSLTLSHDGDSMLDQYSSLTDQVINNQPRSGVLNMHNEMPTKAPEFRAKDELPEMKPRKQSYDFESTRLLKNNSTNPGNYARMDQVPPGLVDSNGRNVVAKTRRWSTNEEGGFNQESDRLFREIVMSSMGKQPSRPERSSSPGLKLEEKDEGRTDAEMADTRMLDKILESEDI